MEKVTRAIEKATADYVVPSPLEDTPAEMMAAAKDWSTISLECFSGELLRKALVLASAMADFAYEAQRNDLSQK